MRRDETFHIYAQLTANNNSKYIQKIYVKNIEFANANISFFKNNNYIHIFIHLQILYQIGFNIKK